MRKNIVVGNWKMNLQKKDALNLVNEIKKNVYTDIADHVEVIFAPSYLYLDSIVDFCSDISFLSVASQDCSANIEGAFTGEVSASMLNSCNVEYVILGHSERRTYFNESSTLLKKKIARALENNLKIIFCCGENFAEREQGKHLDIINNQLRDSLFHLSSNDFERIVIAYEPIWAIGTGITATNEQAQEMHNYIRNILKERYEDKVGNDTLIIYGGSCNARNARGLFNQPDIDGALVGGSSLSSIDFSSIIKSF